MTGRGCGKTRDLIVAAPLGATFVWCNNRPQYAKDLARSLGRTDLKVVHAGYASDRDGGRLRGLSDVVFDHAYKGVRR